MRSFFCLLTLIAIAGCAEEQATPVAAGNRSATVDASLPEADLEVTEIAFNAVGAPTIDISVPGMMCPHGCAPKVHEALAGQPGVLDVKVVYETKTATVAVEEGAFDANAAIAILEDEYGFTGSSLVETTAKPESAAPVDTEKVSG